VRSASVEVHPSALRVRGSQVLTRRDRETALLSSGCFALRPWGTRPSVRVLGRPPLHGPLSGCQTVSLSL